MRSEGNFTSLFEGIKAGLLFVGTIVGAGFASGREILTFFAGGAVSSVFAVIAAGIFFFLTGILFFSLGRRINSGNLFKITETLLKKYSAGFNIFLSFCYLILLSAMLAGIDALSKESLGYNGIIPIFSIIMLTLGIIAIRKGIKGLLKINSVLVPIIVIFILAVCLFSLSDITVTGSGNWMVSGFFSSMVNSVLYVSMNMLLSSVVLISAGKNMDKRQIKTASITAAVILTALISLILLACKLNYSQVQGMEMPVVILSLKIAPYFNIITLIILSFAIFTTLISSLYPLKEYGREFIKKETVLYIILGLSGFLLSRLGFTYIVTYMYPVQGIIGVVFIAFCAAYEVQSTKMKFPVKFKKIKNNNNNQNSVNILKQNTNN
jgi:uncharacterized membrane protein YkvI